MITIDSWTDEQLAAMKKVMPEEPETIVAAIQLFEEQFIADAMKIAEFWQILDPHADISILPRYKIHTGGLQKNGTFYTTDVFLNDPMSPLFAYCAFHVSTRRTLVYMPKEYRTNLNRRLNVKKY